MRANRLTGFAFLIINGFLGMCNNINLLFSFILNRRLLMNKTTLFLKLVILFILSFTLIFLSSCASMQAEQGTDGEPWVGELTGMVDAEL